MKKIAGIAASGFFVICCMSFLFSPSLESATLSADTSIVYDLNEQIEISVEVEPDDYTVSSSLFHVSGGEVEKIDGNFYFSSDEPGTFEVRLGSSKEKCNTLVFNIEDKAALVKVEKEAEEKAAKEEAAKKAEAERLAKETAEQERIAAELAEQQRIAAEQAEQERIAAEQAEQDRIAAELAAQQQQQQEQMVWISATGSKYHSRSNCGQMNPDTAYQLTLSEAQARGYDACKRCH